MDISAGLPTTTSHDGPMRWRSAGYWLATVLVAVELGLGGIWDIARIPYVRHLVAHLGYPAYFLVLLNLEGAGCGRPAGSRPPVAQGMGLRGCRLHLHRGHRLPVEATGARPRRGGSGA